MSLRAPVVYCIPAETARVAGAAFPKGNAYMRMRDVLGPIYLNPEFAALYPNNGQPAVAPAQLALVTIMQFAEGLSDVQAADAVRSRIDWKYALALDLTDAGFDASVLSEFRSRLLAGNAEQLLFDTMLTLLHEQGLVKARGRQRTDSTHVLAAVHDLNRLELLGETVRHTLNHLAVVAPDWLRAWVPESWFERYRQQISDYRLRTSKAERARLTTQIGEDGRIVLLHVYDARAPHWLREVPALQILRHVWLQQFYAVLPDQPMRCRTSNDRAPAACLLRSPYDPDARYRVKRTTEWSGYAVHLTESCDDNLPHLITNVETTPATTTDNLVTGVVHEHLANRTLLPHEHLVDAGYVTVNQLVTSHQQHIDLLGPVIADRSWQARANAGFAMAQFTIDWEGHLATCPQGKTSRIWKPTKDCDGHDVVNIRFAHTDCHTCAVRTKCVKTKRPRALTIRPQAEHEALQAARARQHTPNFRAQYTKRAGIEGTISQGTRAHALRRSRYRGLAKTRLMHLLIGAAMNFGRVAAWLADRPRAQTRRSPFAALAGGST